MSAASTKGPSVPSITTQEPKRSTTTTTRPEISATKPYAPWAIDSSDSAQLPMATTPTTANTPPGHTACQRRLEDLTPLECLQHGYRPTRPPNGSPSHCPLQTSGPVPWSSCLSAWSRRRACKCGGLVVLASGLLEKDKKIVGMVYYGLCVLLSSTPCVIRFFGMVECAALNICRGTRVCVGIPLV